MLPQLRCVELLVPLLRVAHIAVRGRRVVANGRHIDRDRIAARYRKVLGEILA